MTEQTEKKPETKQTDQKVQVARKLLTPFLVKKKPETIPDRIDTLREHIMKAESTIPNLVKLSAALNVLEHYTGDKLIEEYEKVSRFLFEHNLRLILEEAVLDSVSSELLREDDGGSAAPTNTTSGVAKTDLPIGTKRKKGPNESEYEESKVH